MDHFRLSRDPIRAGGKLDQYAPRVRRSVTVEGNSERETARLYGLARETVRKMLRYSVPPGYRRQQTARPGRYRSS